MFKIGDELISFKKVYSPSSGILLIKEYEKVKIDNIKFNFEIRIINELGCHYFFSALKDTDFYILDYFITLPEFRRLKINKLKESINGSR